MRNTIPVSFSHNHFSKVYWLLGLGFIFIALTQAKGGWLIFVGLLALGYGIFALKAMTHQVIVQGNRLISKDVFGEKSILITQDSRIYSLKSLETLNVIIRRYNYWIEIKNSTDSLKINANVNNADELYRLITNLEKKIILPKWVDSYHRNLMLKFDENWTLTEDALIFKGKPYNFFDLDDITIENGEFHLKRAGKLWMTSVFHKPVSIIPNLQTFMTLIRALNTYTKS